MSSLEHFAIQEGRTPLYYASWKGHVAVVNELLHHNADVSICKAVIPLLCNYIMACLSYVS